MYLAMAENELTRWIRSQYGDDKRFKSARALSLAAGRNQSAVANIESHGNATPEVLRDIACALEVSPLRLFILAGWLTEDEAGVQQLTIEEEELVTKWRELSESNRRAILAGVRAGWQTEHDQG